MNRPRADFQILLLVLLALAVVMATVSAYLNINRGLIHFRLGQHALGQTESAAALTHLTKSIDRGLSRPDLLEQAVLLLLERGAPQPAFRAAGRLLELRPEPPLLSRLAGNFDRFEQAGLALALYEYPSPPLPLNYEGKIHYAELLRRNTRYEAAIALYRSLIAEYPHRPVPHLALAETLAWQRDYPEALAILAQLLAEKPNYQPARLLLARVLGWDGQLDQAIEQYRLYLGEKP